MTTPVFLHKLLGQKPDTIPDCPAMAADGRTGKCDKSLVRQRFLEQPGNSCCCENGTCLLLEQYPGASLLELREISIQ